MSKNWKAPNVTPESISDFNIEPDNGDHANPFEDYDTIIEPDVPVSQGANASSKPKASSTQYTNNSNNGNGSGSGGNFFSNFSNYANPFNASLNSINNDINKNIHVRERQFSGGNTLDESVFVTIKRDLDKIGDKLLQILWPLGLRSKLIKVQNFTRIGNSPNNNDTANEIAGEDSEEISKEAIIKILDWDLWGPLVITLGFSLILTYLQIRSLDKKFETKASQIFSGSFSLLWASIAVLSLNIQLLSPFHDKSNAVSSGTISLSFFQCVSILGYSIFPIVFGGFLSIFLKWKYIRIILLAILSSWSIYAVYLILKIVNNSGANRGKGDDRIFLIVYPIGLVFGVFSWLCVIS
ncbi:hypothetical protein PACTADRAFT_51470 [Pachysolen tannophilus NRRL Y-2460]|uniref:Protein YIP n=1 Tax=Pachysolen tannophilus NRRL Y-2460 TaxID=669874 RepID=A0A1E4TPN7_PACTA|nr:hypothetical protein PACTADRAFT_51470 [Pachysolen tannophilus NRRL Y-2460]